MFLHNYNPQSILLEIGFIKIHWYGFLITLAGLLGFFIFYKLAKKAGFKKDFIFDLTFWLIIWGLIGARLYYVLSEISYYSQNFLEIFYIWNGGLGIYGAVIAGVIVVYYFSFCHPESFFCEDKKKAMGSRGKTLLLLSILTPALALGQAIGRWGNYFNQELYGLPSNLSWAIPIELSNRLSGFESFTHFHPVFLYESLFCLFLAVFLVYRDRSVTCPKSDRFKTCPYNPGIIFLLYLFLYSLWRFLIEFLRTDPQPIFLNLRLAQWTSLILIILSIIFFFVLRKWYNKSNE